MEEKILTKPHRSAGNKIIRIVFKTVIIVILLITTIALLILTPPVQNILRKKAQTFLSNKLNTKVEIGRVYIGFPKKIVIEKLYVEDLQKDTLISAGKLKVDISMLKLLNSEVEVSQIELAEITGKVKRVLPDTVYNFQFIIDAFAGKKVPKEVSQDSSSMKISVKDIILDKIRLVYNDAITGNVMTLWLDHFDTNIKTFDLDHMNFVIPLTRINGINAQVYQHKPLIEPVIEKIDSVKAVSADPLRVSFDKFQLSNINLDYANDVSALSAKLNLDKLEINADEIDLDKQVIKLKNVQLNNTTAAIRMGKTGIVKEQTPPTASDSAGVKNGWRVVVNNIDFNNNDIDFNNDNEPAQKNGMDFAHLSVNGLTLHADDFLFTPDSIAGTVTKGNLTEKSGLQLKTFETKFLYALNEAYLKDLLLETPGTTIRRSVTLRYPSIEALKKDIGSLQLDLDLNDSRVQVKDILTFVPSLAAQPGLSNPDATWLLNGKVTGSVSKLNIESFQLAGLKDTKAAIRGTINGLPDAKKMNGNLVIRYFKTSRRDIQLMTPKGMLPSTITLPEAINLTGSASGNMANAKANLKLTTTLGNLFVDGTIKNASDKIRAVYTAKISTQQLNLGTIMQNDSLFGPISTAFVASGTGFEPKTARANIKGTISSAVFKKYNYHDIQLNGQLASQSGTFDIKINDPNIRLAFDGKADFSNKFPAIILNGMIDSIKTKPLNLTPDVLVYRGRITADFPVVDPENLKGNLLVTRSMLATNDRQFAMDTISLAAGKTDTGNFLRLKSDAMSFALTGKYSLSELGSVIQQSIQPYYALSPDYKADTIKDYDFYFNAQVINGPLLKMFMPTLEKLDPVNMSAHFATSTGWYTSIIAPLAIVGTNRIEAFKFDAGTSEGAIKLTAGIKSFSSGGSMAIYETSVNGNIADNKVNFLAGIKDKNSKIKYRLGGLFAQPQPGAYSFSLNPDSLMLNYDKWAIASDNNIKLNKGDINITDFLLSKGNQQLSLSSTSTEANSPVALKFQNFRIGTVVAFIKQDSLLADGTINGDVLVKNIAVQPTFTSDLTITDLTVKKDTIGNLALKVKNTTENVFNANVTISGKGNDVELAGSYTVKPANQSVINLALDIRKLQMTTLEAVSMGALTRTKGYIDGKFDVKGTFDKPAVDGKLNFNETGFSPSILGSYFTINKESVIVNSQGIRFDNFTIRDSTNNELNLDGMAATSNFINYNLALELTAENFQALNSTKRNNQLFYGQFYFDTELHIKGTEKKPVIDGDLTVNENTRLTIVLPQQQPGVVEREGIVRFVDMDSLKMDSTILLASYDSINKSTITGMDVTVNIEINKKAEFSLIVDEANGDFLRMKGGAQLSGGIDPSGKTTLTGSYEIEEGSYELSFNFLKRKFNIVKGSKIVWLGEPTRATVSLTATYLAKTAPLTLVENQMSATTTNIYKQKLPFEVNLIVGGQLMKPDIKFDIILPDKKNYLVNATVIDDVKVRLSQLRNEPSELNKQVFALLLLNRFVSENPFASSSGDGFNAESMARQSVSKILSEQLNNLATDLVQGVDLNFDLASSDDYTTGTMQNRTDLNVSLSKQLLNDRLKVTIGSNFELEGPQGSTQKSSNLAGNVALDYLLSKDGRYLLRAYRKNEYEGELDGYIIETGISFIITLDYNHFRELFHLPRQPKKHDKKSSEDNPVIDDTRKAGPVSVPQNK